MFGATSVGLSDSRRARRSVRCTSFVEGAAHRSVGGRGSHPCGWLSVSSLGVGSARIPVQRERRLAVAGDSAPLEVLYNRTRRRRVRTEVPRLDLAWQEPSGHPQRLLDIGLEFISRERVVTFVHGANLTGMRPVNKRYALSRHGSIRPHASSVPPSCCAPRSVPGRSQWRGRARRFPGRVVMIRHRGCGDNRLRARCP